MTTPPHNPPDRPHANPDTDHPDTDSQRERTAARREPGGRDPGGLPATIADQAAAALDVSEQVLEVLDDIVQRLTAVEETVAETQRRGPESRTDYRFELYPKAETDADQARQVSRARTAWERLDDWVTWLTGTYRLTSVIPPCWADHPALREELIGLRIAWLGAWSPRASHDAIVIFHERLWNARTRLLDGNWGSARCDGRHTLTRTDIKTDIHADNGTDDRADIRTVTGFDLADAYRAWVEDSHRDRALRIARDRSLAIVRANWVDLTEHEAGDTKEGNE
ncbi:hypothetical protein [Actinophytocola sp.]|uniref:hypothetical protein n=1 Tax=Actinophytocola sp. TaxID=1872138 RepID=UPI00389A73F5